MTFAETDLYEPVCRFLEEEGYQVQAEVKDCDIAAEKDGELIIVELKKSFQLKLVYQALDRQSLTEQVFVAIPRPQKGQREKSWKNMLKLLKRLEIGLLTVALDSPLKTVDVVLTPSDSLAWKNRKKRERLQAELENRQVSANTGGMNRRKIVTAYREKALHLCCILENREAVTYGELREMGLEEKYMAILRSNVYHWFERVEKGVYRLSEEGRKALEERDYEKVVAYYRKSNEKEE